MAQTWTAIGILAAGMLGTLFYLGDRIDGLSGRIATQGKDLSARIDAQGAELGERMDGLPVRMDGLGTRIDTLAADLGSRIDALGARVDAHLDEHTRRRAR